MTELFDFSFFRNAFFMSLILSVLFGLLSFFVVLRKMSFLGAGIAHTAFGGVALGILLGIHPFYTSLVFCIFAALTISRMGRNNRVSYDSAIGIFFSFSMALGALFISLRKAYTFDLSGYLFGNILGITSADLWLTLGVLALLIPFLYFNFHKLLFTSFEEPVAQTSGIATRQLDTLLLVFLAGIIVVSIKIVGIILVSALVVLPASFGLLISKNYRSVIPVSLLYTLAVMLGGLFLSYTLNTPAGATMVVLGALVYFILFLLKGK